MSFFGGSISNTYSSGNFDSSGSSILGSGSNTYSQSSLTSGALATSTGPSGYSINNTNNNSGFSLAYQTLPSASTSASQQQQDKNYIPSRIFNNERSDLLASTDKRKTSPESGSLITTSPQHHHHHHSSLYSSHHNQLSPSTPYNYSLRSRLETNSFSPGGSGMGKSGYHQLSLPQPHSTGVTTSSSSMMIDKDYIPRTSIYDDPSPTTTNQSQLQSQQQQQLHLSHQQPTPQSFFETPINPLFQSQQQNQQQQNSTTTAALSTSLSSQSNANSFAATLNNAPSQQLSLSALGPSPTTAASSQQQQLSLSTLQSPPTNTLSASSLYYTAGVSDSMALYSDKYDRRWVTIFGFPLTASDAVLDEIESHAHIVDVRYPASSAANWMHVKLDSEALAQDLLTKNGLIVGNCMIGITTFKEIRTEPYSEPKAQPAFKELEAYTPFRKNYDPSEYNNIQSNQNNASKPGLMSKISEYVFGI